MILKIVQAGDPVLREPARELSRDEIADPAIQELIASMHETLRAAPGVGLAAPQVGAPIRLAIVEDLPEYTKEATAQQLAERERVPVPFHVIINPRLTIVDASPAEFFEGCLSLPGFTAITPRARKVRVECLDETGGQRVIEASGWYARILQHEIDHLNGKLYIDQMYRRTFMTLEDYAHDWKEKPVQEAKRILLK